jgi:hypothetical protein
MSSQPDFLCIPRDFKRKFFSVPPRGATNILDQKKKKIGTYSKYLISSRLNYIILSTQGQLKIVLKSLIKRLFSELFRQQGPSLGSFRLKEKKILQDRFLLRNYEKNDARGEFKCDAFDIL